MDTTTNQILSFIQGRFPQARIGITDDIFACGYINSLFAMELVMFLEKTFGFMISNDDLNIENFRTVSAMTSLVGRQRTNVTVG
jgi:acyl carrier protein